MAHLLGEPLDDLPDTVVRPARDERVQLADGVLGTTRREHGEHIAVGRGRDHPKGELKSHDTIVPQIEQ